MKLTAIVLIASCLQISAKGISQSVTYSGKDIPLQQLFAAIKVQTGYVFFYDNDLLNTTTPVTLSVKNAALEDVLKLSLKGSPLKYVIRDRTVFISPASAGEVDKRGAAGLEEVLPIIGRVVDAEGKALSGVNVVVKGSTSGAVTDGNGKFEINAAAGATLVISYIGFESQEVKVGNSGTILVSLKRLDSPLDEVQIIAYGQTTKRFDVGNVATVKSDVIEKQPVSNVLEALVSRVPGLFITQTNGLPGSGVTVRIQGQNSIRNGSDPLYVIDEVVFPSQLPATGNDAVLGRSGGLTNGSPTGVGSPLSYLNPLDIESISVLKDAAATAIYGSQAANGAIIVTTKKGKVGQTKVDINLQNGWGYVTKKLNMLNTQQYLEMRREAFKNDGLLPSASPTVASPFKYAPDLMIWDTSRYTDWQKLLLGGTAQNTTINASISGGTPAMQYLISGTYHRETTLFSGNFSDQSGAIHFNINSSSANRKLKVQLTGNYMVNNNQLPQVDLTKSAIFLEPDAPAIYNADGTLNWEPNSVGTSTWNNPFAYLYNFYRNNTNNLLTNANIGYSILPGLELKSSFGYTNTQTNDFSGSPLSTVAPEKQSTSVRSATYGSRILNSWVIEPQLGYKKNIGRGRLDALIGATARQNNSSSGSVYASGFVSDLLLENIKSATALSPNAYSIATYKYSAAFGRINYNWQDRYIIDLTARQDGSSRFGAKSQFNDFWSMGTAWIFSQEVFFKKALPFISFGKLKGSYGTTGSDAIADYYFLDLYGATNVAVPYQGSGGLLDTRLANPYLAWEETRKLSLGIDLGFFKDRILFNANYSQNRSSNQLFPYTLPVIAGYTSITENFHATVQNTTWESSVQTINIKNKNFTWSSNVNFSLGRNKLIAFDGLATSSYRFIYSIGQPLSLIRNYHFLGVDPQTGIYLFADSHGNPTPNPSAITDAILSTIYPKYYGGVENSFRYKDIQLDMFFSFVNQQAPNTAYIGSTNPGFFNTGNSNQLTTVLNRWQKPGDNAGIQKFTTSAALSNYAGSSDAGFADALYMRLKNLSLSYQLPETWIKKAHLQNGSLYLQAQNLLTVTSFKGMDPETGGFSLPPLKVITLGIRAGL